MVDFVNALAPPMIPLDPFAVIWTIGGFMIFVMLCKQFLIYMGKKEEQKITKVHAEKVAEEKNSLRLTQTFGEYEK